MGRNTGFWYYKISVSRLDVRLLITALDALNPVEDDARERRADLLEYLRGEQKIHEEPGRKED